MAERGGTRYEAQVTTGISILWTKPGCGTEQGALGAARLQARTFTRVAGRELRCRVIEVAGDGSRRVAVDVVA